MEASSGLHQTRAWTMTARTRAMTVVVAIMLAGSWMMAAALGHQAPLRSAHSEPARIAPPADVAVTAAGKTFHKAGCSFIHGPARLKSGVQAVADGYTPCTRCLSR
jgi:hypothetical protein